MFAPVEIRNSTSGNLFPALAPFLLAGLFGFFTLQGLSPSSITSGRVVLLMAVLALFCAGVGLVIVRGARDTSVQVVLDENGFRDRRRGDVLVPWAKVRGVRSLAGRMGRAVMLAFELTEPMPDEIKYSSANALALMLPFDEKSVRMEIATLDMPARDIIATIRHFAPGVVVEG